jgi:hypothetical protein
MMDALDGALNAADRRRLMAHLDSCARCSADWDALNVVESAFASPKMLQPAPGFPARVEARIAQYESQRRTLVGGLILLGGAVVLCLLTLPALLDGRSPLAAYGHFLQNVYDLLGGVLLLSYKLAGALWLTLEAVSRSTDVPLPNLLTYLVGVVLAVAALRRARTTQRVTVRSESNGH